MAEPVHCLVNWRAKQMIEGPPAVDVRYCGRIPKQILDPPSRMSSAAHRAYYRAPGRPQTAAFAPQYCADEMKSGSTRKTYEKSKLQECVTTKRVSLEANQFSVMFHRYLAREKTAKLFSERVDSGRPRRVRSPGKLVDKSTARKGIRSSKVNDENCLDRLLHLKINFNTDDETIVDNSNGDARVNHETCQTDNESGDRATDERVESPTRLESVSETESRQQIAVYHFNGESFQRRYSEDNMQSMQCGEPSASDNIRKTGISVYYVDLQVGDNANAANEFSSNRSISDLLHRQHALVILSIGYV